MATEEDRINTGALATLVAVGAFAMIGISLALVALVRDQQNIERSSKDDGQSVEYRSLKKTQLAKLESGVPIETAMSSLVKELSANPHTATPPPRAGAAPAPAPEGAAPAPEGAAPAPEGSAPPASGAAPVEPQNKPGDGKNVKLAPGASASPGSKPGAPPNAPAPPPAGTAAPGSQNGQ